MNVHRTRGDSGDETHCGIMAVLALAFGASTATAATIGAVVEDVPAGSHVFDRDERLPGGMRVPARRSRDLVGGDTALRDARESRAERGFDDPEHVDCPREGDGRRRQRVCVQLQQPLQGHRDNAGIGLLHRDDDRPLLAGREPHQAEQRLHGDVHDELRRRVRARPEPRVRLPARLRYGPPLCDPL